MPRIQTSDGTELFYRDWGTGRPVVFVHGMLLSSGMWQHQMLHLAENGFRAVASTVGVTAVPMTPTRDTTSTRWPTTWPRCSTGSTLPTSPWSGTRWAGARSRAT